jgi:hypothetical protein
MIAYTPDGVVAEMTCLLRYEATCLVGEAWQGQQMMQRGQM